LPLFGRIGRIAGIAGGWGEGITSNPSSFEKVISDSADYDDPIQTLVASEKISRTDLQYADHYHTSN